MVYDGFGKLVFYSSRSYDPDAKVKALTYGSKIYHTLGDPTKPLVVVEDVVSALKVARYVQAFPAFGSSVKKSLYKDIIDRNDSVYFWLDSDKYKEAMKLSRHFRSLGMDSGVIFTKDDPKDLDDHAIKLKLKNAGLYDSNSSNTYSSSNS